MVSYEAGQGGFELAASICCRFVNVLKCFADLSAEVTSRCGLLVVLEIPWCHVYYR